MHKYNSSETVINIIAFTLFVLFLLQNFYRMLYFRSLTVIAGR